MPLGYNEFGQPATPAATPEDLFRRLVSDLVSKGTIGQIQAPAAQYGSVEAARLPASPTLLATPRTAVSGYAPSDVVASTPSVVESLIRGQPSGPAVTTIPAVVPAGGPVSPLPINATGGPVSPLPINAMSIIQSLIAQANMELFGGGPVGGGPVGGGPVGGPASDPTLTIGTGQPLPGSDFVA